MVITNENKQKLKEMSEFSGLDYEELTNLAVDMMYTLWNTKARESMKEMIKKMRKDRVLRDNVKP